MGLFKSNNQLHSEDVIQLTPNGKEQAEKSDFGGNKAQILIVLSDGATQVKEISDQCRIPLDKVKKELESMKRKGWMQVVTYE